MREVSDAYGMLRCITSLLANVLFLQIESFEEIDVLEDTQLQGVFHQLLVETARTCGLLPPGHKKMLPRRAERIKGVLADSCYNV